MTLEQWKLCCEKAIRSNFKTRNVRVFSCKSRHQRIARQRRTQVREWVVALRQARNPESAPMVEKAVFWKIA